MAEILNGETPGGKASSGLDHDASDLEKGSDLATGSSPDAPSAQEADSGCATIPDLDDKIRNYARLLVKMGCALRPGQELLISTDIECRDFARVVVEEAYAAGCKRVYISWSDGRISRLHYDNCALSEFESFPEWDALRNNSLAERGAAVLTIESSDPDLMKGVDPAKISAQVMSSHKACASFYDHLDFGKTKWCIAGAPSAKWAQKVFEGMPEDKAVGMLWDAILSTARADGPDPIADWDAHDKTFEERKSWLNSLGLVELRYRASNGTDISVGLPEGCIWHGGAGVTVDGERFFPNIPTEEIYTSPDFRKTEGVVHSALPLVFQGNLIDDFWIRFEGGVAVDCGAGVGEDVLRMIIGVDEGSARLGEVALVPYSSPIRQTGITFYSTLYDENASCHMALGKSFPECVEGGLEKSKQELLDLGLNDSTMHVDFMVGARDLSITGVCADGSEVALFEDGEWADQ